MRAGDGASPPPFLFFIFILFNFLFLLFQRRRQPGVRSGRWVTRRANGAPDFFFHFFFFRFFFFFSFFFISFLAGGTARLWCAVFQFFSLFFFQFYFFLFIYLFLFLLFFFIAGGWHGAP